jgi:hypothetical protein
MLEEPSGHQTRNMSTVHGCISLNGPNVHVLLGSVDISTQTGDERLHRPHKQHVFDEEQIQFWREETGYQFDMRPCVSALVVSLESHNGAGRPIECPIRTLCVTNEIAFILRKVSIVTA